MATRTWITTSLDRGFIKDAPDLLLGEWYRLQAPLYGNRTTGALCLLVEKYGTNH